MAGAGSGEHDRPVTFVCGKEAEGVWSDAVCGCAGQRAWHRPADDDREEGSASSHTSEATGYYSCTDKCKSSHAIAGDHIAIHDKGPAASTECCSYSGEQEKAAVGY